MGGMAAKRRIGRLLSVFALLLFWWLAAFCVNSPLILPSPAAVFMRLTVIVRDGGFWRNYVSTLLRCAVSFSVTAVLGVALGILCGLFEFFAFFMEIPLAAVRGAPVVSFILVALFWFTSGTVPVFVSVVMTLPIMTTSVASGLRNSEPPLLEMAAVFRFSEFQKFRWIKLPVAVPFIKEGAVSCFGLTWKVVAAGEVLCIPRYGLGAVLQRAQVHLETADVVAVSLVLIATSFVFQAVFFRIMRVFGSAAGNSCAGAGSAEKKAEQQEK